MNDGNARVAGTYLLLCIIWGTTWVAIKASLESLTPFMSAGTRFLLASVVIYTIMKLNRIKLQTDNLSVKLYLLMGFFSFIIPFGLVYWAQQFVPSGLSAVLFAVYPFFVAIFSYFRIPEEKIGIVKIIGIILGFSGIVIIFSDSFGAVISDYIIGMLAIVLSGAMQANIAVTLKKSGGHLNSLSMNLIPMLLAGFIMMLVSLATEKTSQNIFDLNAVISVSYLAIFGSVITFTSFYWLLKRVNVVILSLIAFITPIVALIAGWLIYMEQLTTRHFIGSVTVLAGLLWANAEAYLKYKTLSKKVQSL